MPARIPLILGTANWGAEGTPNVRIADTTEAQKCIDLMVAHGYPEIDTARVYAAGTAEELVSKLQLTGVHVDTKIASLDAGSHKPSRMRECVNASLTIFKPKGIKIRTLYLHNPDRTVPIEEVVEEINRMHKEGIFEEFGLSNYKSWEVAHIHVYCKEKGLVLPTVYTGNYNIITRSIESELIPCLRKYNIQLRAWNPLAAGFLTGRYLKVEDAQNAEKGSRFDLKTWLGPYYHVMYSNEDNYKAVGMLTEAAKKEGLTIKDVALRWVQHHSKLLPTDAVIIGGGTYEHIEENVRISEEGPLPESILPVVEEVWKLVSVGSCPYAN